MNLSVGEVRSQLSHGSSSPYLLLCYPEYLRADGVCVFSTAYWNGSNKIHQEGNAPCVVNVQPPTCIFNQIRLTFVFRIRVE